jgi:hypothetical protein
MSSIPRKKLAVRGAAAKTTITAIIDHACQAVSEYRVMLGAALHVGVTPVEARELVYQAVPYVDMANVFDFIHATNEVLASRGIELPLPGQSTTTPDDRLEKGLQVQKSILGDRIDQMYAQSPKDLLHVQRYLSGNCFGDYLANSMFRATVTRRRSAFIPLAGSEPPCSTRLDCNTQPFRSLAQALVKAQQSEPGDRGTRNEQRREVDGIQCPNRVPGKRLTCAINYLARYSQDLPMSSGCDEVRSTVGGFGLCQFLERHRSQHYAITLGQGQVGSDDDLALAKQAAHCGCGRLVKEPCQHRTRLRVEIHRGPRSSSSNWATLRRRSPCLRSSAGYKFVPAGAPRVRSPRLTSD